jgi:hypothetical protein
MRKILSYQEEMDSPDHLSYDGNTRLAAAWRTIWAHTREVAPKPLDEPGSSLQHVLDLITKGAQHND